MINAVCVWIRYDEIVFARLISILGVSIGNSLRWPPDLFSYSICTFFIINNAIAKVGETESMSIFGKQESSDLFMLMMIVVIKLIILITYNDCHVNHFVTKYAVCNCDAAEKFNFL